MPAEGDARFEHGDCRLSRSKAGVVVVSKPVQDLGESGSKCAVELIEENRGGAICGCRGQRLGRLQLNSIAAWLREQFAPRQNCTARGPQRIENGGDGRFAAVAMNLHPVFGEARDDQFFAFGGMPTPKGDGAKRIGRKWLAGGRMKKTADGLRRLGPLYKHRGDGSAALGRKHRRLRSPSHWAAAKAMPAKVKFGS